MTAKVISLNVVHQVVPDVGGSVGVTSIDKRPVTGSRLVTDSGVTGDQRSDMKHHGSPRQAVYAYAKEDYQWWETELGLALNCGQFGENLTTENINLNNLVIGSQLKIGNAVLRVTAPRIPCGTFQRWMNLDQWVKRFTEANRAGAYFEVVNPGEITAEDTIEIKSSPDHGVTISDYFLVYTGDRDVTRVERCANCPDIDSQTREKFAKFLSA